VQEAANKRVSSNSSSSNKRSSSSNSSSSSSSSTHKSTSPVEYDPDDVKDVNFAALLAGMGIKSGVWNKQQRGIMDLTCKYAATKDVTTSDEALRSWGVVMSLVRNRLELPSGPLGTMSHWKRVVLDDLDLGHRKLMQDATVKASVAKAEEMREEQRKQGAAELGSRGVAGGRLLSGRALKVCIGCGVTSSAGKMQKCSRCLQSYACSPECFTAAWKAFHKHSCRKAA